MLRGSFLSKTSQRHPSLHSLEIDPEKLGRRLAITDWQIGWRNVPYGNPDPRIDSRTIWANPKEKNAKDPADAATKI